MTYSVKTYHLLQSPYPTNCINYYSSTEFLSIKDCIRRCRLKESFSNCKVISDEINVFKWETSVRFVENSDEEKCIKDLDLIEYCSKFCSNMDCVKHYYKPVLISGELTDRKEVIIDLTILTEPETTFWHKPKIETIEFLCYIASILSIWFGFSILSIYFWIKRLIGFLRSKCLNKKI